VVLLMNLVLRIRLDRPPSPPRPYGAHPPLPAGRPLCQRLSALGFLVPILLVGFVAIVAVNSAISR
jgi:hypothetical protein